MFKYYILLIVFSFSLYATESDDDFFDNQKATDQSIVKLQKIATSAHSLSPTIQHKDFYKKVYSAIKKKYSVLYLSRENSKLVSDLILDKKIAYLHQIQLIDKRDIEDQNFKQALWDFHVLQQDIKALGLKQALKKPFNRSSLYQIQKRYPSHLSARHLYLYSKGKLNSKYSYTTAVQKIFTLSVKTRKFTNSYKYQKKKSQAKITSYLNKFKRLKRSTPSSAIKLLKAHLAFCSSMLSIDKLNRSLAQHNKDIANLKKIKNRNQYNRAVKDINSKVSRLNKKRKSSYADLNKSITNLSKRLKQHIKKINKRFKD